MPDWISHPVVGVVAWPTGQRPVRPDSLNPGLGAGLFRGADPIDDALPRQRAFRHRPALQGRGR